MTYAAYMNNAKQQLDSMAIFDKDKLYQMIHDAYREGQLESMHNMEIRVDNPSSGSKRTARVARTTVVTPEAIMNSSSSSHSRRQTTEPPATVRQMNAIRNMSNERDVPIPSAPMTKSEASSYIDELKTIPKAKRRTRYL